MDDSLYCSVSDCKYNFDNGRCHKDFKGLDLEVTDDGQGIMGKCDDYKEKEKSMLKHDERNGYTYTSQKTNKTYDLLEGISYKGTSTSDIVFIFDPQIEEDLPGKLVGWFYGTENYNGRLLEILCYNQVSIYENKMKFDFTNEDIDRFKRDTDNYLCDVLAKKRKSIGTDIKISIGNHNISVPHTSDNTEMLYEYLKECRENTVSIKVRETVDLSCYSGVIQSIWKILGNNNVDGHYGIDFLTWFQEQILSVQNYIDENDAKYKKDLYFAIKGIDIKYGDSYEAIQDNSNDVEYVIECTEDCGLYKLV